MNRWKWKHTSLLLHLKLRFCEDHRRWVEVTFLRFLMLWSHILQKDNWKEKGLNIKAGCFVTRFFYTYGQYLGQGLTNVEKPIKATESYRNCFKQLWAQKCKKKKPKWNNCIVNPVAVFIFCAYAGNPSVWCYQTFIKSFEHSIEEKNKKVSIKVAFWQWTWNCYNLYGEGCLTVSQFLKIWLLQILQKASSLKRCSSWKRGHCCTRGTEYNNQKLRAG